MSQEPQSLAELHRIREQIYEAEQRLSPPERLARLHQQAEAYLRRTGLKLQRIAPPAQSIAAR